MLPKATIANGRKEEQEEESRGQWVAIPAAGQPPGVLRSSDGGTPEKALSRRDSLSSAHEKGTMSQPLPPFHRHSALVQIYVIGVICFCCPGMFNALNALGGAGHVDATVTNNSNVALYACFAVVGLFAGAAFNLLGPRILMSVGGLTYSFFAIAQYLAGVTSDLNWLAILSGGVLGCGAGLLWTAQGALMLSYSTEKNRGTYISIFWTIFNLGGFVGGLVAFALNFHNESGNVGAGTYFAFCGIMAAGALSALLLLSKPSQVRKDDGTMVEVHRAPGPSYEVENIFKLFLNKNMLMLLPLFLCSNWFYTYQFTAINGYLFTARTRSLNSALYWGSQMIAAYLLGNLFLDKVKLNRRPKALVGGTIVSIVVTISWGLGLNLQKHFERGETVEEGDPYAQNSIDFKSSNYGYPLFVFLLYGFADAIIQCYCYWLMGALSNDMAVVSRYAGFYKGIQSSGAAVAWRIDTLGTSFMTQLIINWVLFAASLPTMFLVAASIEEKPEQQREKDDRKDALDDERSSRMEEDLLPGVHQK